MKNSIKNFGKNNFKTLLLVFCLLSVFIQFNYVSAHERRFAFNYETSTMPKGVLELENYITWSGYDDKDKFEFKHELEYGITDNFQVALYAVWSLEDFDDGKDETKYKYTSLEFIYSLSDPVSDALGSALYLETAIGEEIIKLEGKLLLQKNIGPLAFVYNFILEAEWEGDDLNNLNENKGEIENTLGVSYQINPSLLFGIEAVHEFEISEWEERGDDVLYAGPNVSVRKGDISVVVAALFQVSDVDGEADNKVRMIAAYQF